MAATEAAKELVWIRSVAEAVMGHGLQLPICLYGDNSGPIASGITIINYVPTDNMLADGFTRPLLQLRHWCDFQTIGLLFGGKWLCPFCLGWHTQTTISFLDLLRAQEARNLLLTYYGHKIELWSGEVCGGPKKLEISSR